MNLALILIVGFVFGVVLVLWNMFGKRNPLLDAYENESEEERPELLRKREFAEHLISNNVYTRVYDAFHTALGGKPTLDDIVQILKDYRDGKTSLDTMESYIRDNMTLPPEPSGGGNDDGGDEDDSDGNDGGVDEGGEEEGGSGGGDGSEEGGGAEGGGAEDDVDEDAEEASAEAEEASAEAEDASAEAEEASAEGDVVIEEFWSDNVIASKILQAHPMVSKGSLKKMVKEISGGMRSLADVLQNLAS